MNWASPQQQQQQQAMAMAGFNHALTQHVAQRSSPGAEALQPIAVPPQAPPRGTKRIDHFEVELDARGKRLKPEGAPGWRHCLDGDGFRME